MARDYYREATRFLRCTAAMEDIRVVDGNSGSTPKAKVRTLRVEAEVDVRGRELAAVSS